ncbi:MULTISPECIES: DUF896 domain-containing protein [Paenibacillus]|uniref:DUF896 domain-containing protein n=1 Tax=Paenibacillus TaxID=44249 RepID=UPI002041BDE9|nr:DUF896 domain-containing protein [Paenibacillus camelliae]MCM3631709.1 DUF896 domain-containing protein [Paenibacillus camelliae]
MDMDKLIARINVLAKKNKTVGLTPAEQAERAELRAKYLATFKSNFKQQLDSIKYVEDEQSDTKPLH